MFIYTRIQMTQRTFFRYASWLLPAIAGCIMVLASIATWYSDPLGGIFSAWQLPIDIDWQFHSGLINYGLLCCLCASFTFVMAIANWKPFKGSSFFIDKGTLAGLLCLAPVVIFLFQYIIADPVTIDHISQHEIQLQLIQRHFTYDAPSQLIQIYPLATDSTTVLNRIRLLLDVISIGAFLPLLSAGLLFNHRRFSPILLHPPKPKQRGYLFWTGIMVLLVLSIILFGRAPAALYSGNQAKSALSAGNYTKALWWLNMELELNPSLDNMDYYHIQRGQALFYLHPNQPNIESYAYLASVYSQHADINDAYQQLFLAWQSHRTIPWIVNDVDYALEKNIESTRPLQDTLVQRMSREDIALYQLQLILEVDPSNIYGHYLYGLIQYDLHNYSECMKQMTDVIHLNSNSDVLSSAYTYIALSYAGQGDILKERSLLLIAISLDPSFYNNTAREELSGLR